MYFLVQYVSIKLERVASGGERLRKLRHVVRAQGSSSNVGVRTTSGTMIA
jgi:hypothetical protein